MSVAYDLDVGQLVTMYCAGAGCGVAFAMPADMNQRRQADGKEFYCPNGHRNIYTEPEVAKLTKRLDNAQKRIEWAEQATTQARQETRRIEKSRSATKGVLTKVRQRVARGCCPQCSTTFADLAAHMQAKHPEK